MVSESGEPRRNTDGPGGAREAPPSRRLAVSRHREIMGRLDVSEMATVEELAQILDVSRETIRRDLKALAARGMLTVVHGGALRRDQSEAPFAERQAENRAGKAALAALAVGVVSDGMSILLASGTTIEAIAERLARSERRRLTVHTTSFANARALARLPGTRVILLGGEFDPNDEATTGPEVRRAIGRLAVDLSFVGVGGIGHDGVLTDYTRAGAALRAAMLGAATHGFLAADHLTFGRRLAASIEAPVAGLFVDRPPSEPLHTVLTERGIRTIASGV